MAEHRVSMLSPALHRHRPDPERSRDPRIRTLVGRLRGVPAPDPRPEFRDELRAQLVAITPRVVAEEHAAAQTPRRRPSPGPAAARPAESGSTRRARLRGALRRVGQVHVGKPVAVLTCVLLIFAALLGGAVWISKRALPGDTLYGLKRAGEHLQESFTSGDSDRAKLLLGFADTRYGEVSDLLPNHGGAVDTHTADLVTSTLDSADNDIHQAMQALGSQAIQDSSGTGLALVVGWAGGPMKQLHGLVDGIPSGALRTRGAASLTLLTRADQRARALKALGSCGCLAHAGTDSLGALPCRRCSSAVAPVVPGPAKQPTTGASTAGQQFGPTKQTGASGTGPPSTATSSSGSESGSESAVSSAAPPDGSASGSATDPGGLPAGGLSNLPSLLPSSAGGSCAGLDLGVASAGSCGVDVGSVPAGVPTGLP